MTEVALSGGVSVLGRGDAVAVALGLMTRVAAKLLAYMVGFVANEVLGRPGTALKILYR